MKHIFAFEEFKRFRKIDFNAIVVMSLLYVLLTFVTRLLSGTTELMVNMFILGLALSFLVLITRKSGAAVSFYMLTAVLLSFTRPRSLGLDIFLIFLISAVVFELAFLVVKYELKSIPFDVVIATAFSVATVPLATGLVLSYSILSELLLSALNLFLLGFFLGMAGAIVSFLIWYEIRNHRFFVRFEAGNFMF